MRSIGASLADAAAAAQAAAACGPAVAIVVVIEPPEHAGARLLRFADGRVAGTLGDASLDQHAVHLAAAALGGAPAGLHEGPEAAMLYVEAHRAPERLLVVGAGHIAVPLAALGIECGFRVLVLDDREAFATAERFAPGVEVRRADFEADPFNDVTIDARTSVALVTRGHRWDFECLTRLLDAPERPRYIGMIGSRRRVRAAFIALGNAGVPRQELAGIHAPIGLDIGAETPAEIAVSIMAELIQVRRGGEAESLARRARVLERLLPETTTDVAPPAEAPPAGAPPAEEPPAEEPPAEEPPAEAPPAGAPPAEEPPAEEPPGEEPPAEAPPAGAPPAGAPPGERCAPESAPANEPGGANGGQ